MKPYLPAAPLTYEDLEIWYDPNCPGRPRVLQAFKDRSMQRDRQDAVLMNWAQMCRHRDDENGPLVRIIANSCQLIGKPELVWGSR